MVDARFEQIRTNLEKNHGNLGERNRSLSDIKELIEQIPSPNQNEIYNHIVFIVNEMMDLLRVNPIQFEEGNESHKARLTTLEILLRLVQTEAMKRYIPNMISAVTEVMWKDVEENTIMAIKIYVELIKVHKSQVSDEQITSLFSFCKHVFKRFGEISRLRIPPGQLIRGENSLKVIIECGSSLSSLYQNNMRQFAIKDFINIAFTIIEHPIPDIDMDRSHKPMKPQAKLQEAIEKRAHLEFISCQAKILNFLAQFVKSDKFYQEFKQKEDHLARSVIEMMHKYPHNVFSVRKDLFTAFSFIIKSNHKVGFNRYIDDLLNEEITLGTTTSSGYLSTRGLCYSAILEFMESSKHELSVTSHLEKAVQFVCRNLHVFPQMMQLSLQFICYAIQKIKQEANPSARAKLIFNNILHAICKRLSACKHSIDNILRRHKQAQGEDAAARPAKQDPELHECVSMLKLLITGPAKELTSHFIATQGNQESNLQDENTIILTAKLVRDSIHCSRLFSPLHTPVIAYQAEETKVLDYIPNNFFTWLVPTVLLDIMKYCVPYLFISYIENKTIKRIFTYFKYQKAEFQRTCCDALMPFLIRNLELLGPDNPSRRSVFKIVQKEAKYYYTPPDWDIVYKQMFSLFNLLFKLPFDNKEYLLQTHGKDLIERCAELHRKTGHENYINLAKHLIRLKPGDVRRSIGNEWPKWLNQLEPLLYAKPSFPHIIEALKSNSSESIGQALLSIDYAIHIYGYEAFYQMAEGFLPEILLALNRLLYKYNRFAFSSENLTKILGKLGGEMRKIPIQDFSLKPLSYFQKEIKIVNQRQPEKIDINLHYIAEKTAKNLRKERLELEKAIKYHQGKDSEKNRDFQHTKQQLINRMECEANLGMSILCELISLAPINTSCVTKKVEEVKAGVEPKPLLVPEKNYNEILGNALGILFEIRSFEELGDKFRSFYQNLSFRFSLLMFVALEGTEKPKFTFDPCMFIKITVQKLIYKDKCFDTALSAIKFLHNVVFSYLFEKIKQPCMIYIKTLDELIHGCMGLDNSLGSCQALRKVLKEIPSSVIESRQEKLIKAALHVLSTCTMNADIPEALIRKFITGKFIAVELLAKELCTALLGSNMVRDVAIKLLGELSTNLPELLDSIQAPLSGPLYILGVSLKQQLIDIVFSYPIQHKTIETYSFIISNRLVTISDDPVMKQKVINFIEEVINMIPVTDNDQNADEEEEKDEEKIDEKVAALRAMKSFLALAEVWELINAGDEKFQQIRNDIVFRFLRLLTKNEHKILEVVQEGVKIVLSRDENSKNILPQEELKICLRPILLQLAKNQSPPTIDQLNRFSRLLSLIANCFNKILGDRLVKHLTDICRKEIPGFLPLIPALLSLFHLMPDSASELLPELTTQCIENENNLRKRGTTGYISSPFKEPLIKFYNRFPEAALDNFYRIEQYQILISLLRCKSCFILRSVLADQYENRIMTKLEKSSEEFHIGLNLLYCIVKHMPRWISTKQDVVDKLLEIWNQDHSFSLIESSNVDKYIIKTVMHYIRYGGRNSISYLFKLPPILYRKSISNYIYLTEFLQKEVAKMYSPYHKRKIMKVFVCDYFHKRKEEVPPDSKIAVIENLIIPLLNESFKLGQGRQIIDKKLQVKIMKLIRPKQKKEHIDKVINIQLMNLSSVLIKSLKDEFHNNRKELIRFSWNMLKSENPVIKGSAYVNVSKFISVYNIPENFVLQMVSALLKSSNNEINYYSQQAFEHLIEPIKRLMQSRPEPFFKGVRKVLTAEIKQGNSMIHILNIIIKNHNIFYDIRGQILNLLITAISNLRAVNAQNYSSKRTLIDLTTVLLNWDSRVIKEEGKERSDISPQHKENLVSFFARMGHLPNHSPQANQNPRSYEQQVNSISNKCIDNLKFALQMWGHVNFQYKQFAELYNKNLSMIQQQRGNNVEKITKLNERTLDIVSIFSQYNDKSAILDSHEILTKLINFVKTNEQRRFVKKICGIIENLIEGDSRNMFFNLLSDQIEKCIESEISIRPAYNLAVSILKVLNTWPSAQRVIEHNLDCLVKIVKKLAKDVQETRQTNEVRNLNPKTLKISLNILMQNLEKLNDTQKKSFLQSIECIIEHGTILKLLKTSCDIINVWIETLPNDVSIDEQCELMIKLFSPLKVEKQSEQAQFYEIALKILQAARYQYEFTGARFKLIKIILKHIVKDCHSDLKNSFYDLLFEMHGCSIWRMLLFIIEQADWDYKMWVKGANDALLAILGRLEIKEKKQYGLIDTENNDLHRYWEYFDKLETSIVQSLRSVSVPKIICEIWIKVFPQVFANLDRTQKTQIICSLEESLIRRVHLDYSQQNTIRTVLLSLMQCDCMPIFRPEYLQYLGKKCNAWTVSIPILESYLEQFPNNTSAWFSIENLYEKLNEREYEYGCKLIRATDEVTKNGIDSYLKQEYRLAKKAFETAFRENSGESQDMLIWEQGWEQCALNLGEWKALKEFGENNHDLALLEASWHLDDWQSLNNAIGKAGLSQHPQAQLLISSKELSEKKIDEVDLTQHSNALMKMFQPFNEEWKALPKYLSLAKIPILQNIQLFVEFRDGITMIKDAKAITNAKHKITREIDHWRERSLPVYEQVHAWHGILKNRLVICNAIKETIKTAQSGNYSMDSTTEHYLQDSHYIRLTMTRHATSQGLLEMAVSCLPKPAIPKIETLYQNEHYMLLKEKTRLLMKNKEYAAVVRSLAPIRECKEYKEQASELWRIKGMAYYKMGDSAKAQSCFSYGVELQPNYPKTWLSWATVNDQLYQVNRDPATAADAIVGYILGSNHDLERATLYVPRILYLLEKVPDQVSKFNKYFENQNCSIYLPWLQQIIQKLPLTQSILLRIAEKNLNSIFPYLNLLRNGSNEKTKRYIESVIKHIQENNKILFNTLDHFYRELESAFRPTPIEDLYSTLEAMLQRLSTGGSPEEMKPIIAELATKFPSYLYIKNIQADLSKNDGLLMKLKQWKTYIYTNEIMSTREVSLENLSLDLCCVSKDIEIPGIAGVYIDRVLPDVKILKSKNFNRVISILGSNGKTYQMMIYVSCGNSTTTGTVISQIQQCFNLAFRKHAPEKFIQYQVQHFIPISQTLSLVTIYPEMTNFDAILTEYMDFEGKDFDIELLKAQRELKIEEQVLNTYMQRRLFSMDKYFVWRKQFTVQWALFNLLTRVLKVSNLDIGKLWISLSNGSLFPGFTSFQHPGRVNYLPAIEYLIGKAGMYGVVRNTYYQAARAIKKDSFYLDSALQMILGDRDYYTINIGDLVN